MSPVTPNVLLKDINTLPSAGKGKQELLSSSFFLSLKVETALSFEVLIAGEILGF